MRSNPERLTELTQGLNGTVSISGQGAYVPTVKAVRQIRRAHLGDAKPGVLYFELLVYEGFTLGPIKGESWAEITASTLRYLADRLPRSASPRCAILPLSSRTTRSPIRIAAVTEAELSQAPLPLAARECSRTH